jgi:tetratricopeptide (TPR) repeat protein
MTQVINEARRLVKKAGNRLLTRAAQKLTWSFSTGCREATKRFRAATVRERTTTRPSRYAAIMATIALSATLFAADSLREEGVAAYRDGRYSVARAKLKDAVAADANDQTSRLFLALSEAALNNCSAALPELTKASDGQDPALALLAGLAAVKCHAAAGNNTEALLIAHRLSERFPKDADVLYTLAKLHMKAFNDATYAMFERTPSSYRVHELSAEIFEVDHRYTEAAAEYRKAIAMNPKAVNLHFRLGRALLLESHDAAAFEAAKVEFQAELQLSPEDAACEFQLGQIAQAHGNRAEAKQHFGRALELSPSFTEALVALGKIETQEKHFPEAITLLERAVELEPTNENAHYALMMAYRDSGQMPKAKAEKAILDKLQKPPEGEFTDFLKKLGEKPPDPK